MILSRRSLLKGFVATAAGLLLPETVAAEPGRRIWALDRTMIAPRRGGIMFIMLDGRHYPVRDLDALLRAEMCWQKLAMERAIMEPTITMGDAEAVGFDARRYQIDNHNFIVEEWSGPFRIHDFDLSADTPASPLYRGEALFAEGALIYPQRFS